MVAGFGFARQVIKVITKDRTRDVISLIDERLRNEEFSKFAHGFAKDCLKKSSIQMSFSDVFSHMR